MGIGIVVSAFTFPGVVVHELSHQICCRICRTPVYEVKYFQLDYPYGYVVHEPAQNPWKNLFTAMGPFFINTILGMLITLPAYVNIFNYGLKVGTLGLFVYISSIILYWFGISVLMHAFPSTGDAKSMVQSILKNKEVNAFAKVVTAPFIGLIYLGAFGSMFWLDLIYGVGMSMVLPKLLGSLLF